MASFLKVGCAMSLLLHVILLLSVPVFSDEEDHLLQGLNSYRATYSTPALQKNGNADCLADKVAGVIEHTPCPATGYIASKPGPPPQVANYPDLVKKCRIDATTIQEALVLPVCVPERVATLVLTNYTQTPNSGYLNSTKYTGAGVATEDDWTVLILTTSTPSGSLVSGSCLSIVFNLKYHALVVMVGLLVWVL